MSNKELDAIRIEHDFANRFAGALAKFDADLAPVRISELKPIAAVCFFDAPIQLRRQPACQQQSGRSESGGKIDLSAFDLSKMKMRRRVVEKLRDGEADFVEPR